MTNVIKKFMHANTEYAIQGIGGSSTDGMEIIYLTQQEYDALSAAEKADTTKQYAIYDTSTSPVGIDSDDVSYDNTTSGLTATNVQDAIDEIAQGGGGGTTYTAGDGIDITNDVISVDTSTVAYDNTTSGLTATNVQDAIDEIDGSVDNINSSISTINGDIADIKSFADMQNVTKVTTMPVPEASDLGTIVQYTGDTTSTYTQGYFYQCVETTPPGGYLWERVVVQTNLSSFDSNNVEYNNTTSGLTATTVQEAIDEIAQGGSESSIVTFIEVGDSDLTYDSTNNRYNISSTKATEIMDARETGKNIVLCVTSNDNVMLLSNIGGGNYYVDFSGFREISSTGVKSWIGHIELDGSGGIRYAYIKMNKEFDTMTRMTFYLENGIYTYNSTLDRYVPTDSFANDYREKVEYSGEYVIQLRNSAGRAIDTLQLVKREFSNGEYARYDICGRVKYDSSNTATQIHIHLEFDGSDNYLPSSSTYETKTITYAS